MKLCGHLTYKYTSFSLTSIITLYMCLTEAIYSFAWEWDYIQIPQQQAGVNKWAMSTSLALRLKEERRKKILLILFLFTDGE